MPSSAHLDAWYGPPIGTATRPDTDPSVTTVPAAAGAHRGQHRAGHALDADDVGLQLGAQLVGRRLLQRAELVVAGVVDEDVEPPARLAQDVGGRGGDRIVAGDVEGRRREPPAGVGRAGPQRRAPALRVAHAGEHLPAPRANRSAVARPIPDELPVIRMDRASLMSRLLMTVRAAPALPAQQNRQRPPATAAPTPPCAAIQTQANRRRRRSRTTARSPSAASSVDSTSSPDIQARLACVVPIGRARVRQRADQEHRPEQHLDDRLPGRPRPQLRRAHVPQRPPALRRRRRGTVGRHTPV